MYSPKFLSRMLNLLSADVSGHKCGLDDDELKHAVDELDKLDCGLDDNELKIAIEKFKALPEQRKQEIAACIIDRKIYEEDICNRYGISRPTIYRWQESGKLPRYRHEGGGKNYMFQSEADRTISEYENKHK